MNLLFLRVSSNKFGFDSKRDVFVVVVVVVVIVIVVQLGMLFSTWHVDKVNKTRPIFDTCIVIPETTTILQIGSYLSDV